jgi:predicted SnoaL-like aldol condensation-catalyzing enzyme
MIGSCVSVTSHVLCLAYPTLDFASLDFFRIEDGVIAEHWESVDWVRAYQFFGLPADEVKDG